MQKLVYANEVAYELPATLADLAGPASGVVDLPRYLYWGPERTVDLSDRVEVQRMYQAVVRIGTVADQIEWLNREVLLANWDNLVLPTRCLDAWEARFPELKAPQG